MNGETARMKDQTYVEAKRASTFYFDGDELAADVFVSKYALKDADGRVLEMTPTEMHRRLAREFARIEARYPDAECMTEDEIFALLDRFRYLVPQGSPMSAIGNHTKVQSLSNCFVIEPPLDSYGSIARADEEILQIQKRRGGVGIDLSNIRPAGIPVKNAAATSDGVLIFMDRYSNTTREVAQGGRRGALMETIDVRHPDVETFINAKLDLKRVTGANVSVRVTDEFMQAVENDADFVLRWPCESTPTDAVVTKTIKARQLWQQMMHAAWQSAEPGVLFWDNVLSLSMADEFSEKGFKTVCTNPCSELPLSANDSCRLLLINVFSYVRDAFLPTASFDFELFRVHVRKAQRLMDDLVDLELEAIDRIIKKIENDDPEPISERQRELTLWRKIETACRTGRRTGTGITALGDALAALGLRYGSDESIVTTEEIYKCLATEAHASSVAMALTRGCFPAWEPGHYAGNVFAERLRQASDPAVNEAFDRCGRRNIALTTTAPAGSVSIMTKTTSGIEPVYQTSYLRRKKLTSEEIKNGASVDMVDTQGDSWQEYTVYHPGLKAWMAATTLFDVASSPYAGAASSEIDWEASVDLLAAAQRWTEHSISKTVNLPANATVDHVSNVYFHAWKVGVKGLTVYRDGSRSGVLVVPSTKEEQSHDKIVQNDAPRRPKELECDLHRISVKGETYLVIVGLLGGKPYEVFAGVARHIEVPKKFKQGILLKNGKRDGVATYNLMIPLGPDAQRNDPDDFLLVKDIVNVFDNPTYGSFTRTLSLALRHGVPVQYIVEQLQKDKHSDITSFSRGIARVLSKSYISDGTKVTLEKSCTECGGTNLQYLQGCSTCSDCGASKCG